MSLFVPRVDDALTVTLPNEQLRARVTRVIDADTVIVEIGQPFMRTHNFKAGDLVGCRRTPGVLGEAWQAIEVRPAVLDLAALAAASPVKTAKTPSKGHSKPSKPVKTGKAPQMRKGNV